jgi:hypothetical protein
MVIREVVKTITRPDGQHRVDIFMRDDGFFGFVELKYYERPQRQYWASLPSRNTITATAEAAEREARASIDWLIASSS